MLTEDFWFEIIGIPWCRKENYDALLAISEDAKDMPRTWEGFSDLTEQIEDHWKTQGRSVERVDINPYTFQTWCASKGYRVNARARSRFAYEMAARKANRD